MLGCSTDSDIGLNLKLSCLTYLINGSGDRYLGKHRSHLFFYLRFIPLTPKLDGGTEGPSKKQLERKDKPHPPVKYPVACGGCN